jgi:hypothetical protein
MSLAIRAIPPGTDERFSAANCAESSSEPYNAGINGAVVRWGVVYCYSGDYSRICPQVEREGLSSGTLRADVGLENDDHQQSIRTLWFSTIPECIVCAIVP